MLKDGATLGVRTRNYHKNDIKEENERGAIYLTG
jgi:hypothetical protein